MFEQPLLIYSTKCNYSNLFLHNLTQHPSIQQQFMLLNIDINPQTRKRPHIFYDIQNALSLPIVEVPTIIVNNGEYMLAGEEAFKWLQHEIDRSQSQQQSQQQQQESQQESAIEGFNAVEMTSLSDQYAPYGSESMHDASSQSYKFVDRFDDRINTPAEDSVDPVEIKPNFHRETFDNVPSNFKPTSSTNTPRMTDSQLSDMVNLRLNDKPRISRQNLDFTSSSFGFAGKETKNGQTQKQAEIKLQSLIAEREHCTPSTGPRAREEDIDWTAGKVKC